MLDREVQKWQKNQSEGKLAVNTRVLGMLASGCYVRDPDGGFLFSIFQSHCLHIMCWSDMDTSLQTDRATFYLRSPIKTQFYKQAHKNFSSLCSLREKLTFGI